jgi:hypothetical protein
MSITVTTLPTATIGGSVSLCQNSTPPFITFTGSNSSSPYTFTYNINGGSDQTITTSVSNSTVNLSSPTSIPGNYVYNLISVSVGNCINLIPNQTATISVFENPTITMSDQTICGGGQTLIQPIVTPQGGQFNWQGLGINGQTGNSVTVSPASNTSYNLTYIVNGCSISESIDITVIQNPNASITYNDTICLGQSTVLVASPIGAAYNWTGNNILTPTNQQQITVNPISTTTYTVTTQIGNCPTSSTTVTLTVNPIPTVTAAPGATICIGQSTTIGTTVSSPDGTYAWTPSGTNSSLTVTPTLSNPTVQQIFTYSVVYTLNGCPSLPSSSTVTVNPKPTVSVNNLVFCSGNNGTIEANPNLPGGQYNWSTGLSGTIDSLLTVTHVTNPVNEVTLFTYDSWYILNGCSSDTVTSTVTVNPIPTLTSSNSATICSGETLNIPLTADAIGSTFNWIAADNTNINGESTIVQSSATINNTLGNLSTSQQNVVYTVTPIFGNCPGTPQTVNVVINPNPFVNPINEIICSGGSFDTIPDPNALGNVIPSNTLYTWNFTNNTSVTGEAANAIASTNIFGGPLNNALPSNTSVIYSVTPSAGPCIGANFNVNITITATPEISDKSVSICSGNSPAITAAANDIMPPTTLYTWTILTDNSNITGQSVQSTPVANLNNQILVNTTSSPQTITYTLTPQSGPCPGQPFNLIVTVNPGPSLVDATYEICSGNGLTNQILGSPGDIIPNGTEYSWNVAANGSVDGETGNNVPSSTFNTGNLINTTNVDQIVVYSITPIGPSSLQPQCNGAPFQVSIVVNPTPNVENVNLQPICSGTNFTFDPFANPQPGSILNTNTILNWTVTPNANVTGYSNYNGTGLSLISQTLTNNSEIVQTLVYNVTAIDTTSQCSSTLFTVTIDVHPTPQIQDQTDDVCSGTPFNVSPSSTLPSQIVPAGTLYSWLNPVSNPNGAVTGGAPQTNQTIISQVLSNSTLSDASLTYTVTPTYVVSNSLTCVGQDFLVTVTVRPIPTVSATAADPIICAGSSTTLTAVGNPGVNSSNVPGSYNWTPLNAIVGTSTSSVITAQPASTTTFIVVYTLSGCPSQATPVTVTVQNPPDISTFTALEGTICDGGCTTISANFTGSTAVDYVVWSTGQTTTTAPHTIVVCPTSTTQYTATAYLLDCAGSPSDITINVNPDPSFISQPYDDTTLCVGGTVPLFVQVSGGAGTPQYQWYQNTSNSNTGGTAIAGATNSSYIPPIFTSPGTYFYYCRVSYSPSGCGFIVSNPSQVNVVADPQVLILGEDEILCIGGTPNCLTAIVSGGFGSNSYSWNPGSGNSNTFCPPASPIGTTTYNVTVNQTGVGCSANSTNSIIVNIIPDPVITINGIDEVCIGAEVQLSTTITGGTGSVSNYQWAFSSPPGAPFINIFNSNSPTYLTTSLLSDISYNVNITQTGKGCNASDEYLINVFQDPVVELIADPYSCIGTDMLVEAQVTGGTPNSVNLYTWYALNPSGPINPLLVQNPSIDNTYSYISIGDTTIFVNLDNSGFGCDIASDTITILGLIPAIAAFGPSSTTESFYDPTFSFVNESQNATDFIWDLGECDPQLPISELFATPSFGYNPTSVDILDYTYACPPGFYTVTLYASNLGYCSDSTFLSIAILPDVLIYVPNTFTPDGDQNNNLFFPFFSDEISKKGYVFRIYDRWGEIAFETNEIPDIPTTKYNTKGAWDGSPPYGKKIAQDGTYTWEVIYSTPVNEEKIRRIGHVNLLK